MSGTGTHKGRPMGRPPIDLAGQTFGTLATLRRDPGLGWLCRCSACGAEARYPTDNLRRGYAQCPCQPGKRMGRPPLSAEERLRRKNERVEQAAATEKLRHPPDAMRYEDDPAAIADLGGCYPRDLTGLPFGQLVVTGKSPWEPNGWRVSCDCGLHTVRTRQELVGGRSKSCGCGQKRTQFVSPQFPSLAAGQQFGRLTVVERVDHPKSSRQGAFYRCACECGGETVTKASHLRSEHTRSCGCRTQETQFQPGSNEPPLAAPEHSGRQPANG
jgi:hypothetical protein